MPAGTPVEIELADKVTTNKQKPGATFAIRLAQPLIVSGMVVLPAGALGQGEVIDSAGPSIGGKPAAMVLAADYVGAGRKRVPLSAELAAHGHDNSEPAMVLKLGGIATMPLGVIGTIVPGGAVTFQSGTVAWARVSSDVTLAPVRRATHRELADSASWAASARAADAYAVSASAIALSAPPRGEGQVVFFRAKSLTGTGQWFNVRENGQVLGKLSNGAYFVQPEPAGPHTYTAKLEPELKDKLTLRIDPGQTYFVEGTLTAGLVLSAADLQPSSVETFNKVAAHLSPAPPPTPETAEKAPGQGDSATSANGSASDAASSDAAPASSASPQAPASAQP